MWHKVTRERCNGLLACGLFLELNFYSLLYELASHFNILQDYNRAVISVLAVLTAGEYPNQRRGGCDHQEQLYVGTHSCHA